jgi:radical SAM superfamily enzyme YgiQ (UPF0313 family)
MPRAVFVSMSGFRVREREMLALGMTLPGFAERSQAVAALPPLGLLTLGALTPAHWDVSLYECAGDVDLAAAEVLGRSPDIVAISTLTASSLDAYALADRVRAEGVPVVIGGLHVTALPGEAALHADAVVVGEGELVWPEVLGDAEAGRLAPRYQADRPFDLRCSPVPRFDLLRRDTRPRYTIQTARGCPLACEFCSSARALGPYRVKPAERVRAELDALVERTGARYIELADDNSFLARREAKETLAALAAVGVRYFTEADWRLGERHELLAALPESGCVQVLVGVEGLAPRHSGMGAKAAPLGRIEEAIGRIQDAGVAVLACFVVGADGETWESIGALGEYLEAAPFADVQLTLQTPFPGTALHARLAREGRLLPDRDWSSFTLFDVTHRPDILEPEELERAFRELLGRVFGVGPTQRRAAIRQSIWRRGRTCAD